MKRFLVVESLLIALLWLPITVQALIVNDLYEVEIVISNQNASNRTTNIVNALQAVLIKLTGDRQIALYEGVPELLANADRYIQQFEYRHKEDGSGSSQSVLWARFDKPTLDDVLYKADIPQWGRERPLTLVWLVMADAGGRRLIGSSDFSPYSEQMNLRARERGIVLAYPLLDLEDSWQLKSSDVWGDFHDVVLAASKRYSTDVVVTSKVEAVAAGRWEARWLVYLDQKILVWVTQGGLPEITLMKGIDALADILARQYGQVGVYTQPDEIEINISGITDYDQYKKAFNYLESLNSVNRVDVKQVVANSVTYILTTEVDASAVSKAIALGKIFEEVGDNDYRLVQ